MTSKIVISIPINLDSKEIASILVSKYGQDYEFIERVLRSQFTNESCEIDICKVNRIGDRATEIEFNRDASLVHAVKFAGDKINAATLQKINDHQQVIYLISTNTGYDACLQIARFAQVLLEIGGIAIKVESAGIAHEKDRWLANHNSDDVFEIYSLFVALVEADDYYYSCGMHNFGKADVAIDITEDIGLAIYVMNVFNYYRLTESPILQDGHTFQPDIASPTYQIEWIQDDQSETDSPLFNSYGRWYLYPIRD
ncbi:MAG: hypothetical protein ACFCU7_16560 [Pleurocapsa sp.]